MRADRGFTVIEIIVVIVIILTLAAILVPVLFIARRKGREAECLNNMRQIHLRLQMYRDDNISRGRELNPPWLNTLVWDNLVNPDYDSNPGWDPASKAKPVMKQELLICPLDGSKGKHGGKPNVPGVDQYPELDEYDYFLKNRTGAGIAFPAPLSSTATRERRCSYMYEFNMARGTLAWGWYPYVTLPGSILPNGDPNPSFDPDAFVDLDGNKAGLEATKWGEAKAAQMRYGDTYLNAAFPLDSSKWHGYAESRFPVLRCFWHTDDPDTHRPKIANLSYAGQVFFSGSLWEEESMH